MCFVGRTSAQSRERGVQGAGIGSDRYYNTHAKRPSSFHQRDWITRQFRWEPTTRQRSLPADGGGFAIRQSRTRSTNVTITAAYRRSPEPGAESGYQQHVHEHGLRSVHSKYLPLSNLREAGQPTYPVRGMRPCSFFAQPTYLSSSSLCQ